MILHNKLSFDSLESDAVVKVIESGFWAGGSKVKDLEKELKYLTQRKYSIAVSSGLSAITLALLALNIKKGDEVIIPAYSCVAIVNAVLFCKAKPVPVDILMDNWNINTDLIIENINSNTKAIIFVNTFGSNVNFNGISHNDIPIIEDCAHAIGPSGGKYVYGKNGLISITSFYATKFIGGGEGGAVLTDDKNIADFILDYRDYTDKMPNGYRLNYKMSDIHASITLCQLKKVGEFKLAREKIASKYNFEFSEFKNVHSCFFIPGNENRVWYRYVFYVKDVLAINIIKELELEGVVSAMPIEFWINESEREQYPIANFAYKHLVSIPIYPSLNQMEILDVIKAVKSVIIKLTNGRKISNKFN